MMVTWSIWVAQGVRMPDQYSEGCELNAKIFLFACLHVRPSIHAHGTSQRYTMGFAIWSVMLRLGLGLRR